MPARCHRAQTTYCRRCAARRRAGRPDGRRRRESGAAGGLAFNALLIHSLETSGRWKNIFVQPVSVTLGPRWARLFTAGTPQPIKTRAWRWTRCAWGHTIRPKKLRRFSRIVLRLLSADRRRTDRERRGPVEREQDRRLDAGTHGVRAEGAWNRSILASLLNLIPPRT
jgi:hypothetical protein